MNDIIIIGSGPSSLLTLLYLVIHMPYLKYSIVSKSFNEFHCTYGVFIHHLNDSWIFNYLDKDKLITHIYNIAVKSPNEINTNIKYGIIDNEYLYNAILKIIGNKAQFAEKKVLNISKIGQSYFVKCHDKTTYTSRFVIEGTGKYGAIGVKYRDNYPLYKQYFIGYKLKTKKNIDCSKCILLDWNSNSNFKSFGYIIPYDKNTVLIEETVLSTLNDTPCNYRMLEKLLHNRIKSFNDNDNDNVEFIEKDSIPLNVNIPCFKQSKSFGIGQCGNIINHLSGYTISYNIAVIPEICNLIMKNNYNLQKVYGDFWTIKRRLLYTINIIGLHFMESLTKNELIEFHNYYFNTIVSKSNYNFNTMFLCNNYSIIRFIFSFRHYIFLPKKLMWKIIKSIIMK